METKAVALGCRNDGYKEDKRVIACLNSMIETFDEVLFCDWNSPKENGPLLWKIKDKILKTGKLKHFIIPEEIVQEITQNDPTISPYAFILAQNLMLKRSTSDWFTSTAVDIIAPKKEYLDEFITKADPNTFYSVSRREAEYDDLVKMNYDWRLFRDELDKTSQPRIFPARVTPNDNYSLINCCGDFQLAHKDLWYNIKGFEEKMYKFCFIDTNVQKKALLNGFNLEAKYEPALFHIEHEAYHINQDGKKEIAKEWNKNNINDKYNDVWDFVEFFQESLNSEDWGLLNTDIEYEIY